MTTDLSKFSVAAVAARDADAMRKAVTAEIAAAVAASRQAVLDDVRKTIGGSGKVPPEDVGWTNCTPTAVQARMVNGWIELRGTLPITRTNGYVATVLTLPAAIPVAAASGSYPVCCREVGVAPYMGYVSSVANSRAVSFSPIGGFVSEITVTNVRFQAGY
jgi:hypothetical protein